MTSVLAQNPRHKTLDLNLIVPLPSLGCLFYLTMWHGVMLCPMADHPQPWTSRDSGGVGTVEAIRKARCRGQRDILWMNSTGKGRTAIGAERSTGTPTLEGAREKNWTWGAEPRTCLSTHVCVKHNIKENCQSQWTKKRKRYWLPKVNRNYSHL